MLRLKLELVPHGLEELTETIGTILIVNDLSHPDRPQMGNYQAKLSRPNPNEMKQEVETQMINLEIKNFPRMENDAWELVQAVLNACYDPDPTIQVIAHESTEDEDEPYD